MGILTFTVVVMSTVVLVQASGILKVVSFAGTKEKNKEHGNQSEAFHHSCC